LIATIAQTLGVTPYFDMSFQHASAEVLRRMRRFGSTADFLTLIDKMRVLSPECGIRSNVIVGFPGETEADVAELENFLTQARLDAVGVFGFSPEDGTEAADLPDQIPVEEVARRVERVSALVEELVAQRAEDRIGTTVEVLVESIAEGIIEGRSAHQAPEVDGTTRILAERNTQGTLAVGDIVVCVVESADGADLVARVSGSHA
jgi:tRNA A37 methylthiotransferase MiaB